MRLALHHPDPEVLAPTEGDAAHVGRPGDRLGRHPHAHRVGCGRRLRPQPVDLPRHRPHGRVRRRRHHATDGAGFIDDHYKTAAKWARSRSLAFLVPDVYIFVGTRELPTRIVVMVCVIIALTLTVRRHRSVAEDPGRSRREAGGGAGAARRRGGTCGRRAGTGDRARPVCLNWGHEGSHPVLESLTGNTRKAGEMIAGNCSRRAGGSPASARCTQPEMAGIQDADFVLVGTWMHGLFVVGQAPWGLARSPTCRRCAARTRPSSARSR